MMVARARGMRVRTAIPTTTGAITAVLKRERERGWREWGGRERERKREREREREGREREINEY